MIMGHTKYKESISDNNTKERERDGAIEEQSFLYSVQNQIFISLGCNPQGHH